MRRTYSLTLFAMTSDELHDLVNAFPDDDEKRLAFAEHVRTYNPERAEFVELQVKRAAEDKANKVPYSRLSSREYELLSKRYYEWGHYMEMYTRVPPGDPLCKLDQGYVFWRGFVSFARMEPENFVALGERLFRMAPIQHADLYGGEDPIRKLFSSPFLARLDSLSLRGTGLDDDDACAMAECEALQRCTWLDLSDNKITVRGLEALAASPIFKNKVIVNMSGNPADPSEEPHYDWDGSIADMSPSPEGDLVEQKLGRRIPWFHLGWYYARMVPDRYHACWVGRPDMDLA